MVYIQKANWDLIHTDEQTRPKMTNLSRGQPFNTKTFHQMDLPLTMKKTCIFNIEDDAQTL